MNWKIAIVGGLVYYVALFVVGMIGGNFIHGPEGVLGEAYRANAHFWRPELNMDPPDMASMMKVWIPTGIISSILMAAIYSIVRSSLAGSGVVRGIKFGVIAWVFNLVAALGYWGVMNLPNQVWGWWLAESAWMHLIAGAVLGWVSQKLVPANA